VWGRATPPVQPGESPGSTLAHQLGVVRELVTAKAILKSERVEVRNVSSGMRGHRKNYRDQTREGTCLCAVHGDRLALGASADVPNVWSDALL
jgi:predicted DNA-binding protein (UPF0278 family)